MRKGPFFLNIFAGTPEKEDKHLRFGNQRFLRKGKVKPYKEGKIKSERNSDERKVRVLWIYLGGDLDRDIDFGHSRHHRHSQLPKLDPSLSVEMGST